MTNSPLGRLIGRGANVAPQNRFERVRCDADYEHLGESAEELAELQSAKKVTTAFYEDQSQSLIVENDSPDIPFRYSINPYRGCEHGCAYCYARPYHEYLGLNAGVDFETKILVKTAAPRLLREELNRARWTGRDIVAISGVTDCYQPIERELQITRGMIMVLAEARQAFGTITKNALITRDLDLLAPLAAHRLYQANISITTLDADLCRVLEPRTSPPAKRLDAIRQLTAAGIPVRVMVAPIIPGLNDVEIPAILQAAAQAGARAASYVLLRLPFAVKDIFMEWLERYRPNLRERVEAYIRKTRGGELSSPNFGERMRGTGEYAGQIANTLAVFCCKYGLMGGLPEYDTSLFQPPLPASGQMRLF
ncbi:MAG: PA0069 family radical SAM protein [Pirellulales bacterium]|nr:PA0069 family radical SAM protein [Pirellulales bacterium]